jgi:hypothetical protein
MAVEQSGRRGLLRRLYDWCVATADKPHALWTMSAVAFAESSFFPVPPGAWRHFDTVRPNVWVH